MSLYGLAQISVEVGNLTANRQKIMAVLRQHPQHLMIFPELAICGYCPQDLLLRKEFVADCMHSLERIMQQLPEANFIIGLPIFENQQLFNSLVVVQQGHIRHRYHKQNLPNYGVFDENRYFSAGQTTGILEFDQQRLGLLICEDVWGDDVTNQLQAKHLDLLIVINASPFHQHKHQQRLQRLTEVSRQLGCSVCYVNMCGAQDELVFEGRSCWLNASQAILHQLPMGLEQVVEIDSQQPTFEPLSQACYADSAFTNRLKQLNQQLASNELLASSYLALLQGLKSYLIKIPNQRVLVGLSGGIDSAFCLALCVDALGADAVTALALPSQYSSELSYQLAQQQCQLLGVQLHQLNIHSASDEIQQHLEAVVGKIENSTSISLQNIQSRIRGNILMSLSNQMDALLIATGNKSEYAMGYATLYGDMCGAFAPIKDVYKSLLYQLSQWRNQLDGRPVIPQGVIDREPTAELMPNQKDSDSLPEYAVLDKILHQFIEQRQTSQQIINQGFAASTVNWVIKRLHQHEFKRRQAPIGTRISECAFGRDYRLPISQKYF